MSYVIHGKNHYLFLAGNKNAVINQHTGKRLLNESQLHKWQSVIKYRKKYLTNRGIQYYFQVVPDKHPVCKEYLPAQYRLLKKCNIDFFLDYATQVLQGRVNYPITALLSASDNQQVYYKWDSHWTDRGAYVAYLDLMKIVKKDYPQISILKDPVFTRGYSQGDLARMTGKGEEPTDFFNSTTHISTVFDNHVKNTGRIKIFFNPESKNNLTILIFGSSSTLYTLKFLTYDFRNVILYWSGNFDFPVINHYKPDIVISQVRERHLIRPADDTQGLNTIEIAFIKSYEDIGEKISPILFNKKTTLEFCLAKAGNKINQAYMKYISLLCRKLNIEMIYHFAINVDRKKYPYKVILFIVKVKLLINQLMCGSISSRLKQIVKIPE